MVEKQLGQRVSAARLHAFNYSGVNLAFLFHWEVQLCSV